MSKLLKVVYDVADVRGRYLRVHDQVFRFSARRLLQALNRRPEGTSATFAAELGFISQRLAAAKGDLASLGEEDLSIRRGAEIRDALEAYAGALGDSVRILRAIAELHQPPATREDPDRWQRLRALKVTYDDAVQFHDGLGARLNRLLASL